MEVYTNLDIEEVKTAIHKNEAIQLQFTEIPSVEYCKQLNKLLKEANNVILRFYSYNGEFADLSFLKLLYSATKIKLDDSSIVSLRELNVLEKLSFLKIGKTKKRLTDFEALDHLNCLTIIESDSHDNILDIIKKTTTVKELYLTNTTIGDLENLSHLKNLQNLDLSSCKCSNYNYLATGLKNIKYQSLDKQKVENIDFVSGMENLEVLRIESLPITQLPDFTSCKKLRQILIVNMQNIQNYNTLATAKNLQEIGLRNIKHLKPDDFFFLKGCKNIKRVSADIVSKKDARFFYMFLESIGIN